MNNLDISVFKPNYLEKPRRNAKLKTCISFQRTNLELDIDITKKALQQINPV